MDRDEFSLTKYNIKYAKRKENEIHTYIQTTHANIARYNPNDLKHNNNYNRVGSKSS